MVKGLMRQSVHPMEATKSSEHNGKADGGDDDSQRITDHSSEFAEQKTMDYTSATHGSQQQDHPNDFLAQDPHHHHHDDMPPPSASPHGSTNGHGPPPAANDEAPWNRPKGAGGRRLTFADESGGQLAEISYSNRTHYSKQAGPGALSGGGRGCCVIS